MLGEREGRSHEPSAGIAEPTDVVDPRAEFGFLDLTSPPPWCHTLVGALLLAA